MQKANFVRFREVHSRIHKLQPIIAAKMFTQRVQFHNNGMEKK